MGERRLLELKAHRSGLEADTAWCDEHATALASVHQVDTYFRARRGRLKVRIVDGEETGTLIYYQRDDRPGPKRSRITLLRLDGAHTLVGILRDSLGVLVEVRKSRSIYRWGKVQVHLDRVEGLGTFVEFERAAKGPEEEARAREEFAALQAALAIPEEDLVAGSYGDLALRDSPPSSGP